MSHADEGAWAKAELEKLKGVSAVRRALRTPKNYSDATGTVGGTETNRSAL